MAANQSSGGSPWSSTSGAARPSVTSPGSPGLPASAGRKRGRKRGGADSKVQTFRSPTATIVWVVWLLFAVANWVDLAVQGRDHVSVLAAAVLLLGTGIAYVTAQRPRIIADEAGITIKNPLRDHRIGWAGVSKVDLADLLRVHCDWGPQVGAGPGRKEHTKVINSWAVHHSRRRQLAAENKARRASRPGRGAFGMQYGGRGASGGAVAGPVAATEADAELVARLLSERATAAKAEAVWATGTVEIAGAKEPARTEPARTEPARTEPGTQAVTGATGWLEPLKSTWSRSAVAAVIVPALILLIIYLL
jgi:hypothetical protein